MNDDTNGRIPHPLDVHIGKKLRIRRTMLGMNQTELGDAIGVSFQQVQKYERGRNRLAVSMLWDACGVLEVDPSYFFEGFVKETS